MYSKFFTRLFLLIGIIGLFSAPALAQETHTVCDGTTTSNVAPIKNGGGSQTEFIYPASMLEEMENGTISSVKFFSSYTSTVEYTNKVTVYIEEVEGTTENTSSWQYNQNTATKVYEGTTLSVTNGILEIVFSTPYEYNGGNLCFNIWSASSTPSVTYYGENQTYNACGYDYYITPPVEHPYSSGLSKFLPKAEFTYETASVSCAKPKSLNAVDITAHTATLTWTVGAEGQSNWDVYVTTDATDVPDGDTEPTYQVTECSKSLSGLTGETPYYAYVRSVCGGTDGNSTWAKKVFTTTVACPVPILTVLAETRTAYSVDLQWAGNAAADQFEVAYSTTSGFDPNDTEANGVYHRTIEVTPASSHTWTLDGLSPETTYRMRVRANCGGDDGSSSWSDQKSVTTLATCVAPSSLSATATSSTITLSWAAGATGQDAWDIRYKANTDSEYTNIHLDNQTTTSYTITGLNPVTTYGVNVRAWCDENDQSKWGASTNQSYDKSVTTECGAINLPYTCDFEGTTQTINGCKIPQCWSVIRGYYNSTYSYGIPTVANQSSSTQPIAYPHEGTYCLYFLNSTSSGTSEEYAILPEVSDNYKMKDIQIRFWVKGSYTCTMEVGVMTDPSNANTYVKVEDVAITTTYTEKYISLNNYTGEGRCIALKCPAASAYSSSFYVDDITVEYIPSCLVPDNLDVDDIDAFEATLTWEPRGTETAWNVQYKKASDSEWSSPIAVNTTTYTLTGLQRSTGYDARVQANCATDDQSDWTNPISFTTECGIWAIDAQNALMENFNGETFPPDCWQKVNFNEMGVTNGWLQSFNNPLENQGAASSDFKYETWLFLPAMHLNGNAFLSFDHLFGNGDDYIPSSVMITTNTNINVEDIKTTGFIDANFTQIWTADASNLPSTRKNEIVSLSAYNGDDVYIAFRYEGTNNTQGKIWYIDNVEVYVNATQTTQLAQGWNWWSTYIEMEGVDGLDMLEQSLSSNGIIIKSSDRTTEYDTDWGWFGPLQSVAMTNEQMYMIQTNTACSVTMQGKAAHPEDHPITINPGWNWIGFPCNHSISVTAAFADFTPEIGDIIKSSELFAEYDSDWGWFGYLVTLTPGQGFMYYSNSTTPKTLILQSGSNAKHAN